MTKIKGILFDKDGTLLDFKSIWLPAAHCLIDNIIKKYYKEVSEKLRKRLLNSIGVDDGIIDSRGILASGTVFDIAVAFSKILLEDDITFSAENVLEIVSKTLSDFVKNNRKNIIPAGDLPKLFGRLKQMDIKIGLATSDTIISTEYCLKALNVFQYFDFLGTSDGNFSPKPNPELLQIFCKETGLRSEEVAIVGDTITDMEFARNGQAGIALGVLSGTASEEELSQYADFVYKSVDEIIDERGNLSWTNV